MSHFKIFIETTTDLSKKYITRSPRLEVMPLNLVIDGKEYLQDAAHPELLTPVFYDKQRSGSRAGIVAMHEEQIFQRMRPVLERGEDILYLGLSDRLGGSMEAARIAAENLKAHFPERQILMVDTACVSLGQGMLVEMCNAYAEEHTLEETYRYALATAPTIHHLIAVDHPKYLLRFHQVSRTRLMLNRLAGVRPIYEVTAKGELRVVKWAKGREELRRRLIECINGVSGDKIYIAHADALSEAGKYKAALRNCPQKIQIGDIGPAIGVRFGVGSVAVFYQGENRDE